MAEGDLVTRSVFKCFVPDKAIRILESRKFLLVKSGIVGFRIQKPAQGLESEIWYLDSSKIHTVESRIHEFMARLDCFSNLRQGGKSLKNKRKTRGKKQSIITFTIFFICISICILELFFYGLFVSLHPPNYPLSLLLLPFLL